MPNLDNSLDIALDTPLNKRQKQQGAFANIGLQTVSIWLIQLALVVIPAIDTYFLSGINSQNIAGYALGSAFYTWWVLGCKGTLQGLTFVIAPIHGQRQPQLVVNLLVQALWLVALLTVVAWGALVVCGLGIGRLAISDELKTLAVQYLKVAGFGLPAIFGVRALAAWLEGIAKPSSVALWFWSAMLIKVGLTYTLLKGHFGSGWQNTTGTALATNVFYWTIFIGLLAMTWYRLPKLFEQGIKQNIHWLPNLSLLKKILGYGLPIATAYLMEFSLFPTITSLLAVANETALAAYEILSTVYDLVLSLPIALILAVSITVGQIYQNEPKTALALNRVASWLLAGFIGLVTLLLWLFADRWISHYTTEQLIQGMIVAAMPAVLVRGLADGLETLLAFEMRAIDKGWTVVVVSSVYLWGLSVAGIWWGQQAGWLDVQAVWYWLALGYGLAGWTLHWGFERALIRKF